MSGALQAIVFDFDGVIANSEPLHLLAFQQALADAGITLTAEEYYRRYLGFDDVGMLEALTKDRGIDTTPDQVRTLVTQKGAKMQSMMHSGSVLFPGAKEFVLKAAAAVPIAIASGALRHEIDEIIQSAGIASLFAAVVASGDTPQSKPSPDPYRLAFQKLCAHTGRDLDPRRCVAIEDSRWGLESAAGAGLRCVAVTTSYPAGELKGAELVVEGLRTLTLSQLDTLCSGNGAHGNGG
jgi:beta-phosphoglucomutase